MGLELTWVAIAASLMMGLAGACLFVFAVKRDYFRNLEDAKYQVFWSDLEEMVDESAKTNDTSQERKDNHERGAKN